MENREDILDELTTFEKRRPREIPQILDDYLAQIAKTGDTIFPWSKLKPLFMLKMETVMQNFNETSPTDDIIHCSNVERFRYEVMKEKLLEAIDNFNSSAPFTIQRLCELVTCPRKHYKQPDKFMRGLEKNVLVVSTVEPGCSHIFACDCSRKKSENQTAVLNGVGDGNLNGVEGGSFDSYIENKSSPTSSNNGDVNGNADATGDSKSVIFENNKNNNINNSVTEIETKSNQELIRKEMVEESNGENSLSMQEKSVVSSDDVVSSSSVQSSEEKIISSEVVESDVAEDSMEKNVEDVTSLVADEVDSSYKEKSISNTSEEEEVEQKDAATDDEPKQSDETDVNICQSTEETNKENEDDQPSTSNLNLQDNASPSPATPIEDDDEADENVQTSDNDDVTVSVHSLDNEAADIDDNTMDVPLSEDSNSSSLNMATSVDTSSNEAHENGIEPMDED